MFYPLHNCGGYLRNTDCLICTNFGSPYAVRWVVPALALCVLCAAILCRGYLCRICAAFLASWVICAALRVRSDLVTMSEAVGVRQRILSTVRAEAEVVQLAQGQEVEVVVVPLVGEIPVPSSTTSTHSTTELPSYSPPQHHNLSIKSQ